MRDYKRMVDDIDAIMGTDTAAELVDHQHWLHPEHEFTQEEAEMMSRLLGQVYMIAHGNTCACGDKYEIT